MSVDPQEIVDLLESIWQSIYELCSGLTQDEWQLPTDCPGWTVKDQLSHIVGTEWMLAGKPPPDHRVDPAPHVKNAIGEFNEVHVDYRRNVAPGEVLEEFRSLAAERIDSLRAMAPEEFSRQSMTPIGPDTYLEFLRIRAFDCWVHEQDIRRAVGRPGNLSGPAARHSVGRCFRAMPYVVGKKAGAPEGSVTLFEVSYPDSDSPDTLAVEVRNGRGAALRATPTDPTTRICSGVEAYVALCCGRITAQDALDEKAITYEGDPLLGKAVVENLAFMI